ncbi:MAG: hypothetical protein ABIY58_15190 [Acidimicrobiales bacterium]
MLTSRTMVLLTMAAWSITACKGGGDAGSEKSAQPGRPPLVQAKADAAVLKDSDLPDSWKRAAAADQLDEEATWGALTTCLGIGNAGATQAVALGEVARAQSPTHLTGQGTQVTSTVAYLATDQEMRRVTGAFAGPQLDDCSQQALSRAVAAGAPEGATPGPVEVAPLDLPPSGDVTSAHRATATVNVGGVKVPITMDYVVVFKGISISRLLFVNPGEPFPQDLQRSLVAKVAGRA